MGFNTSSLSHSDAPFFITQNSGTLGAQIGLGIILNKNFSVLIESKVFGFTGATITQGTSTLDTDVGFSGGMNLMGLFSF